MNISTLSVSPMYFLLLLFRFIQYTSIWMIFLICDKLIIFVLLELLRSMMLVVISLTFSIIQHVVVVNSIWKIPYASSQTLKPTKRVPVNTQNPRYSTWFIYSSLTWFIYIEFDFFLCFNGVVFRCKFLPSTIGIFNRFLTAHKKIDGHNF